MKEVLYISYDGMTDPLGQSQVIPYLSGLAKQGYNITILSAEKPERFFTNRDSIETLMQNSQLNWVPVMYTKKPPVLSTLIDVFKLRKAVNKLMKETTFDLVHCRSYISPLAGNKVVKKQNAKMIFDMRGFWADERIDGNIWSLKNPVLKMVYKYFKRKEKSYFEDSDAVVSLTHNGKKEILSWDNLEISDDKISVIPCVADFNHFRIPSENIRLESRKKLGFQNDDIVFCYLGSLGTWYLIDDMLRLFKTAFDNNQKSKLLIISHDRLNGNQYLEGIPESAIVQVSAKRDEVPELLSSVDIGLSFIKPCFSKKSSSPTKMGEMFAMGIPMIVNDGVGDVAEITEEIKGGYVIRQLDEVGFKAAVAEIPKLIALNNEEIRLKASEILNLTPAISKYLDIYNKLCK